MEGRFCGSVLFPLSHATKLDCPLLHLDIVSLPLSLCDCLLILLMFCCYLTHYLLIWPLIIFTFCFFFPFHYSLRFIHVCKSHSSYSPFVLFIIYSSDFSPFSPFFFFPVSYFFFSLHHIHVRKAHSS